MWKKYRKEGHMSVNSNNMSGWRASDIVDVTYSETDVEDEAPELIHVTEAQFLVFCEQLHEEGGVTSLSQCMNIGANEIAYFNNRSFDSMDLSGIDFSGVKFDSCTFIGANCTNTNFTKTDFYMGSFEQANLSRANFSNATMPGVTFNDVIVDEHTNFSNAVMITESEKPYLQGANWGRFSHNVLAVNSASSQSEEPVRR